MNRSCYGINKVIDLKQLVPLLTRVCQYTGFISSPVTAQSLKQVSNLSCSFYMKTCNTTVFLALVLNYH